MHVTTECALQSVAYHPILPAYIAAGTANGGVHVWSILRESEDREVGRSAASVKDMVHTRSIQGIAWVHSTDEGARHAEHSKAFLICTIARYGNLLMKSVPNWMGCAGHESQLMPAHSIEPSRLVDAQL
jgi:hypothetical protein